MEFPRFVFKEGAPNPKFGGICSSKLVIDRKEFDTAIAEGWFQSSESTNSVKTEELYADDLIGDPVEPTRKELEWKANELGLKFHPSIKDDNLRAKVEQALKDKNVLDKKAIDNTSVR